MPDRKILIVDADAESRNYIARTLLDQKFSVVQSTSGKEGLVVAWRDHPDLVIIDPALLDMPGEELAKKIRQEPLTVKLPLVALSGDSNPAREKACLDAGFNEYIVKSKRAVTTLSWTINRLLGIQSAVPAFVPTPTTPVAPIIVKGGGALIVVLSAKGGVGTSTLTANIATNIAQNEPETRVAVMDMVLPIGSIAPIVGYGGEQNIVTLADIPSNEASPDFFREKLSKVRDWKFHLLAGAPDPESSNRLNVGRIWNIVSALKMSYDYVLIDLGRSLSKFSLPLIQQADLVTLIVSPDLSTVTLTKTLLDYLKNKSVKAESIFPILNRAVGLEGLSKADVEKTLGMNIKFIVPHLGSNFTMANNSHFPFSAQFSTDATSFLLRDIAKEMSATTRKLRE
jgi:MinD-like ATPase involved in chromosome partitioning or flagellar assembly/ActR/RegA family two-component response regulator